MIIIEDVLSMDVSRNCVLVIFCFFKQIEGKQNDLNRGRSWQHKTLMSIVTLHDVPVVVYDEFASKDTLDWVLAMIEEKGQPSLAYEYGAFREFLDFRVREVLENATLSEFRRLLNFLVLCKRNCIEVVINFAAELDNTVGLRSLLRHFSTWLIITSDPLPDLDTTFDHVTVLEVNHISDAENFLNAQERHLSYYSDVTIHTLMWGTEGRRWSPVSVEDVPPERMFPTLFPNTLTGLNGRQLVLGTLPWPTYTERRVINGSVVYTGAGIHAMDLLLAKLNSTYIIVEPEDKLWGQTLPNGSVTGVLGMVARAEVDTCPVVYGVTDSRARVVGFTTPSITIDYKAVYLWHSEEDPSFSWAYLLSCFTWQVYLLVIGVFFVFLLLLCIVFHLTTPSQTGPGAAYFCFWLGIRVSLRQDISISHKSTYVEFLLYTWSLFCLVMTAVYSGNLVATAAVGNADLPFTTLEELVERDDYEIGIMEGSYAENLLMSTSNPVLKALYRRSRKPNAWSSDNDMSDYVHRVLTEKYVLFAANEVRHYISSQTCHLEEIKKRISPLHRSFVFPRHSPLAKLLDKPISALRDIGFFNKLDIEYSPKPKTCDTSPKKPRQKLNSIRTLFVTAAGFVVTAFIILLFERRMVV